jgi:flagellin-like protein
MNYTKMNKKGISTIVVTIILIVFVLVAAGIVWVIIQNILESGTSDIGLGVSCLKINLVATKMICSGETCNVTINRKAGGKDIEGVKLIFSNSDSGNVGTTVEDFPGNILELGTITTSGMAHGLTGEQPDTVEVAVYFIDEGEREQICPQTKKFSF